MRVAKSAFFCTSGNVDKRAEGGGIHFSQICRVPLQSSSLSLPSPSSQDNTGKERKKKKTYLPHTDLAEDGLQGCRMLNELYSSFFLGLLRKGKILDAFHYIRSIS